MHICSTLLHLAEKDKGKAGSDYSVATYTLPLPGTILNFFNLLVKKKFAGKGNKEGAVEAFQQLEEAGFGKIVETRHRGEQPVYVLRDAIVSQ